MKEMLWVFIGGGLGSICRYAINFVLKQTDSLYPWPTLLANAIGSLLIGVLANQLMRNTTLHSTSALFWIIGFCGGLTTFSTFIFENVSLLRDYGLVKMIIYASLSYSICLSSVFVGMYLSKEFLSWIDFFIVYVNSKRNINVVVNILMLICMSLINLW